MSKKKPARKKGRLVIVAEKHIKSVNLSIPRKKWPKKKPVALIIAGPVRHLPPPQKVWDRGAVFQGWELSEIQTLARRHRNTVIGKSVLQILESKRI